LHNLAETYFYQRAVQGILIESMNSDVRKRPLVAQFLRWIGLWVLVLSSGWAQAQIQRSIVNPSFELPFTGTRSAVLSPFFTSTNWISVDAGEIPGWETTHPIQPNGCPAGGNITTPYNCTPIELWANGFLSVTPAQGIILAELNAYTSSKLFQNICMNTGEVFSFNFAHRGRSGVDRAQFQVGSPSFVILDVSTNTAGTGNINPGGAATGTSATGIANGWTRYAGSFTYTGASGIQPLGFSAISTFNGNLGAGNLLDDINIQLKPFIGFVNPVTSSVEGGTGTLPQIRIVGSVPAGGLSLTLAVSGDATFGADFDYTGSTTLTGISGNSVSLVVTVPAGNYSDALANNIFTLPINTINDSAIEDNETIILTMPPNGVSSNFVNANPTTCGGTFSTSVTHTIIDNDIDLRATKSTSASGTLTVGDTLTYTLTFANVTPNVLTRAPLTGHDAATVTIADLAPAGITLGAWTCTASGTTCPAANGSGAISQSVNLPVGASLTYQLRATLGPATQCVQTVTNTASIGTTATSPSGAGLAEGSSVQGNGGYVFASNSASVSHTMVSCAELSISKSNGASTLTAGQLTTYTVTVSNLGPANANGALLKDPAAAGLSCTSVSCTGSSGAASCGSLGAVNIGLLQGSGVVINNFPANSSYTFTVGCAVTATGQ
jgi:uncharacterized repeat protein (TIGR01451 family)